MSDAVKQPLNYKYKLLKPADYNSNVWKNGLGETQEIAIHPTSGGFYAESYTWRLAAIHFNASCSLSLSPGHECTFVLFAASETEGRSCVCFTHRGEEAQEKVKPLFPYQYSGDWPTTASLEGEYAAGLLLAVNRDVATSKITVQNLESSNEDGSYVEAKILVSSTTLIYVIDGTVRLELDGVEEGFIEKGATAIIKQELDNSPTQLSMSCTDTAEGHGNDAIVAIIEINEQKNADSSSTGLPPRASRRKGSIIIYDDQPMWNVPKEVADSNAPIRLSRISPESSQSSLQLHQWDSARQYEPPQFSTRHANESEVPPPKIKDKLVVDDFPKGAISTAWINMVKQGLSEWIRVPVIIARGVEKGPVIGVTAAVHGNELNGVPCIHRVITDIDVRELRGTVVAIPCVNTPGYLRFTREFPDGKDLNRAFPGKDDGMPSQVYAFQLMAKILCNFDYLIDLHTASFGRVNSYYVRADMNDPVCAIMAQLQQPQIILHNSGQDGTLRSAVHARGVKTITVEIGNPQQFQNQYVEWSYLGVMRILKHLGMFTHEQNSTELQAPLSSSTVVCSKGFWMYTKTGGVLEVYPLVNSFVRRGDLIARIKNIFGNIVDEYYAPCTGITIGRSSNPVAMSGDRILHMGVIKKKNEPFAKEAKENY